MSDGSGWAERQGATLTFAWRGPGVAAFVA
jgi:hypothetical protein